MTKRSIFVSFDYDTDKASRDLLVFWDKDKDFHFECHEGSLNEPFDGPRADEIKADIERKIQHASRFLCLIGENSKKSQWIDWQIGMALEHHKKLVAVKIEKLNTCPSKLLANPTTWAPSFNFRAIQQAIDES